MLNQVANYCLYPPLGCKKKRIQPCLCKLCAKVHPPVANRPLQDSPHWSGQRTLHTSFSTYSHVTNLGKTDCGLDGVTNLPFRDHTKNALVVWAPWIDLKWVMAGGKSTQMHIQHLNIDLRIKGGNGSLENGAIRSSLNKGKMVAHKGSFCLPIRPTKMLVLHYW